MQVVNLVTNQVSRVIGQVESGDRYLWVALYQGDPRKSRPGKLPGAAAESSQKQAERDPTLIATAFTKERFYLFSKREPPEALDALNSRQALLCLAPFRLSSPSPQPCRFMKPHIIPFDEKV